MQLQSLEMHSAMFVLWPVLHDSSNIQSVLFASTLVLTLILDPVLWLQTHRWITRDVIILQGLWSFSYGQYNIFHSRFPLVSQPLISCIILMQFCTSVSPQILSFCHPGCVYSFWMFCQLWSYLLAGYKISNIPYLLAWIPAVVLNLSSFVFFVAFFL